MIRLLADILFSQLSHDAKCTLELLNNGGATHSDAFDEVLLVEKRNLQSRFDVVIRYIFSASVHRRWLMHT